MISAFSVISAVGFCTIFTAAICGLRFSTRFLTSGGVMILLGVSIFAVLRLLLPFEILPVTSSVRSWDLLGGLHRFLNSHLALTNAFLTVWGIGAVICVLIALHGLYQSNVNRKRYHIVTDEAIQAAAERLSIPCPVLVTPDVKGPYVAGFLHPVIYFPAEPMGEEMVEFALAHEAHHVRAHHALIKLALGLVLAVMWWNIPFHVFRQTVDVLLEMRCDAAATAGLSCNQRGRYGDMLYLMAARVAGCPKRPVFALGDSPAVLKKGWAVTQRLEVVLRSKPAPRVQAAAMALTVALFCASYLVVFQGAGAPMPEDFEIKSGVSYHEKYDDPEFGDGAYSSFICKRADGRYQLFVNYTFTGYLSEDEVFSDQYKDLLIVEEKG